METIYLRRRQRLNALREEHAKQADFLDRLFPVFKNQGLLSQYLTGGKNIGEEKAREIEEHLGLHIGYLDLAESNRDTKAAELQPTTQWPFRTMQLKHWKLLDEREKGMIDLTVGQAYEKVIDGRQSPTVRRRRSGGGSELQ